ncbi:homeobox-leucine zipper protein ROC7-like [Primulina eburnea]|uniref:homeobox-leucine zipper protein ROC7-like n=1 Tax=Primulina eburnea TaxID=1245227 RepID=UPI003C6BDBAF
MAEKAVHQFDLNLSGEEEVQQPKRRRHNQHQIQELESFFKDCPNPDYRQRRALGLELGLELQQVRYWFQNKRTQLKAQHGHLENMQLRAENERLKVENWSHMEHLKNAACASCGGPVLREMSDTERRLRAENVQLRVEIDRFSEIAAQYIGKPVAASDNIPHSTAP